LPPLSRWHACRVSEIYWDIHPVVTCTFECSMGSKDSLKMAPKGSKRTVTYAPNAHITTDNAPWVHSFNLTYCIAQITTTSPYCLMIPQT
jgi:hypothetical protein